MSDIVMNTNTQQAEQIIGDRTPQKIVHDDDTFAETNHSTPIESALTNAAQGHPVEELASIHFVQVPSRNNPNAGVRIPHRPDHGHLRFFALAMGAILLGIALAGISLDSSSTIGAFGLSFRVTRPQLFPYVVLLGTLFGLFRFYYYCVVIENSPYAARCELMAKLVRHCRAPIPYKYAPLHLFGRLGGPIEFELGPQRPWIYRRDRTRGESEMTKDHPGAWVVELDANGNPQMPEEGLQFQRDLERLFPRFRNMTVGTRWNYESQDNPMRIRLAVWIPRQCQVAALIEDIDYMAPIWFGSLSIVVFVISRFLG